MGQHRRRRFSFAFRHGDGWQRRATQYLTKGQRVLIVGEMEEPSKWTDQEGNARASLEMQARNVQFLSPRDGAQDPAPDQGEDEEIPF